MYRQKRRKKINILTYILPILVLFLIFMLIFKTDINAKTFDLNDISKVESVLIKNGDTLDSFAKEYCNTYSELSFSQYKDHIIRLNNLSSEYITAGNYILLPVYN